MAKSLEDVLLSLSAASQSLNEKSNLLNKQILEVQHALQKLSLGIEAYVEIYSTMDRSGEKHVYQVGYTRLGGKWALAAADYFTGDADETWNEQTLLEAPRTIRIQAVEKFPDLIQKLVEKVNEAARSAAEQAEAAGKIASGLVRIAK
jgi:hypothetical protein